MMEKEINQEGSNIWQKVAIVSVTVMIALAMVWINTYSRSVKYFKEGEVFLSEGKYLEAVTSFETSAHAYTPWNTNVSSSLERMWEIGETLEREKDRPEYALIAYRSLRSSIYAIRSLYSPYKEWVPRCDEKIRDLVQIQKQQIKERKAAKPEPIL